MAAQATVPQATMTKVISNSARQKLRGLFMDGTIGSVEWRNHSACSIAARQARGRSPADNPRHRGVERIQWFRANEPHQGRVRSRASVMRRLISGHSRDDRSGADSRLGWGIPGRIVAGPLDRGDQGRAEPRFGKALQHIQVIQAMRCLRDPRHIDAKSAFKPGRSTQSLDLPSAPRFILAPEVSVFMKPDGKPGEWPPDRLA